MILVCQSPFKNEGNVYFLDETGRVLKELIINTSNNSLDFGIVNPDLGVQLECLAWRRTDNLLYAIDPSNHNLFNIDATGKPTLLMKLNINPTEQILAGDITKDGRYLIAIGSINQLDVSIHKIDLTDPSYPLTTADISGINLHLGDITTDINSNNFYGIDILNQNFVRFNIDNNNFAGLQPLQPENRVFGHYIDAFGDLYAIGTTVSGFVNGLFKIDRISGKESRVSTGPLFGIIDMASSPFRVELRCKPAFESTLPCSKVQYDYTFVNNYGESLSGLSLSDELQQGLTFNSIKENLYGGSVSSPSGSSKFSLENFAIPKGLSSLSVIFEVGDIATGLYKNQASVTGLPAELGNSLLSDDPKSLVKPDPTEIKVNNVEGDSIILSRIVCLGSAIILDSDGYGGNITWNNGSINSELTVTNSGTYSFNATSGCQSIYVEYNVTVASCPFTVELGLDIVPAQTLLCSEVTYHYIIENESGEERKGVAIIDTLPDGFKLLEVINNPFGGDIKADPNPQVILVENMTMVAGKDTISFKVEVGKVPKGTYMHMAKLFNLPPEIGIFRDSDDPKTQIVDSTALEVIGLDTDSLILHVPLCANQSITLDASEYGVEYIWFDGLTEGVREVDQLGYYDLILFNGCEPFYLGFNVYDGPQITVNVEDSSIPLIQGDSTQINLTIFNEGDSLSISWLDPLDITLSCLDCQDPWAYSLQDIKYKVNVANQICEDSTYISLQIDKTRRIYAPNIFSPNGDGINDIFYLQTPDFGTINSFSIFDRWGNVLYRNDSAILNNSSSGWDGKIHGEYLLPGTYIWSSDIQFIDGSIERFVGELTIVR